MIYFALFIQYWQFRQDTNEQSQIDYIAIEVELVISDSHDDLHYHHSNDVDCNDLQVGIFKLTCSETAAYYHRTNQKPKGKETYWSQVYPYPVDRIMRNIVVNRVISKYIWIEANQRLWLEKWLAKTKPQRILFRRILQIIVLNLAIEI